ncbi:MAG: hypothetical protein IJI58_04395 [Bacilli bacterium]|nr:hypothetical protein [Bacilli bacterium]
MAKKKKKRNLSYFIISIVAPIIIVMIFHTVEISVDTLSDIPYFILALLTVVFIIAVSIEAEPHQYKTKTVAIVLGIFILANILIYHYIGDCSYDGRGYSRCTEFMQNIRSLCASNCIYSGVSLIIYSFSNILKYKKKIYTVLILVALGIISFLLMNFIYAFIHTAILRSQYGDWQGNWKKPIVYIYPEEDMDVEVTVSNPEKLTVTYPKYEDGWKVKALIDGTLIDNNKKYYALYWEGIDNKNTGIKQDGFVIKGEDSASFLEEKLEILGLNYKEKNEFIMYWLPRLESNRYNYIRFMTKEEIDQNMKLNINPEPDTLIRIMMEYKGLDKKIKVKEQSLTRVERKGYTVVEWGGTEIKR